MHVPISISLPARHRTSAPTSGLWQAAAGPLLVTAILHLTLLVSVLRAYDFNPTGPAHIGDDFDGRRFWTSTTHVEHGIGYDGQFFFYLAHDPLLRADDPYTFIDRPAYRYGRALYPALAWMMSLGQPETVPWALLAVNLLAGLVGTLASVAVLRSLGANRWLALGFAFSPAVIIGLIADLAEPTAFALIAVGLALHLRARHRAAGLALALATLAREVSLLVPLGFALHAAIRRAWREAAAYALPMAIPAAWHLWVWLKLGSLPMLQSPANFGPPFAGALYRAGLLLGLQTPRFGEPPTDTPIPELILIGLTVALVLLGLLTILRRQDVFAVQLWLQAAAALCTSPLVWIGLGSYARVLGLLYLFYALVVLTSRRKA